MKYYWWIKNELEAIEDNEATTDNKVEVENKFKTLAGAILEASKKYIKKIKRKIKRRIKKMLKILFKLFKYWPLIGGGFSIIKKILKRSVSKMDNKEIALIGDEIIANFEDVKKEASEVFAEIKEKDWSGVIKEVPDVLVEIQEIGKAKNLSNEDKKAVAVYILNKKINIPVLPEFVEAKIISAIIETILVALKKKFNK